MIRSAMRNEFGFKALIDLLKYKLRYPREHPTELRTFGTCVFCGSQGQGKTLSAVQYVLHCLERYPRCILVSNVAIKSRPFNARLEFDENGTPWIRRFDGRIVNHDTIMLDALYHDFEPVTIEYTGLDMLKNINNGACGVIFLIDEIHLELNSLESKNIDIEVMVEISQQRKQRKHIVGTSQVFMRMAKPLREQIHDIIICRCIGGVLQWNKWIEGETATEKNGKLEASIKGRFTWFHRLKYYGEYDTYTKMRRYNKEWQGRRRIENIYESSEVNFKCQEK